MENLTDAQIITSAYQDAVEKMFANYLQATVLAQGQPADILAAEQGFSFGLALARKARDRAIVLAG